MPPITLCLLRPKLPPPPVPEGDSGGSVLVQPLLRPPAAQHTIGRTGYMSWCLLVQLLGMYACYHRLHRKNEQCPEISLEAFWASNCRLHYEQGKVFAATRTAGTGDTGDYLPQPCLRGL